MAAMALTILWLGRERLSLSQLAEQEASLRSWYQDQPLLVLAIAAGVYITFAALSIPVGTPLAILYGWLFGVPVAVAVVNVSATLGAVLAFWSSRYLFREYIEHWLGDRRLAIEQRIEREGALYLIALRLIPVIPFFVVNLAMGLTRIRTRTFWWASQLAMLPATCVFVSVGASVPSLKTLARDGPQSLISWQLLVALAMLGILPLLTKKVVEAWKQRHAKTT